MRDASKNFKSHEKSSRQNVGNHYLRDTLAYEKAFLTLTEEVLIWKKKPNSKSIQARFYVSSIRSIHRTSQTCLSFISDYDSIFISSIESQIDRWYECVTAAVVARSVDLSASIDTSIIDDDSIVFDV